MSLFQTRFGANATGLPGPAPLPPLSAALSRRAALFGAVTVAGVSVAAAVPSVAEHLVQSPDAALIARADALKSLRVRELRAWHDLASEALDDGPESEACSHLSDEVRAAGETLAEVAATTTVGLAAKASATLALVGRGRWAETEAFTEHHSLVASVLRDAAGERSAPQAFNTMPGGFAVADHNLAAAADTLDALQAHADRHAADANMDPDDPYNQAVAEMDRVVVAMAALPAETMGGVMTKVRAMAVPIVRDDDEARRLAVSVCRDLQRLFGTGVLA